MRFIRRSLVGLFMAVLTVALLAGAWLQLSGALQDRANQDPRAFERRERVIAVNTVALSPQTITPEMTAYGELASRRSVDLRSPVGGALLTVSDALIDGGQVAEGALLLRIDPVQAQAALDRASADLRDAQAEVRDADAGLILAQDDLAAARTQSDLRKTALDRALDLQDRGAGTAATVEAAELALANAQAAVLARRQALAAAQARIDQAATRLTRADIALQEARRTLSETEVRAPFSGRLTQVTATPGGRIAANERFATLLDPAALEVRFRLSTAQYVRLLDGDGTLIDAPVTLTLDSGGAGLATTGRITREAAMVGDGQTGRLLYASLTPASGLRPGDFVTVRIAEPALDNVALIPATAVAADDTVLVIGDDDRLQLALVTLLRRQGDDVIVDPGDHAGANVVAERSPLLGAGIKVRPIGAVDEADHAELITLDAARRDRLIAFVTGGGMPDDAKARLIAQLQADQVPADTVTRLEARMGS